MKGPVKNFRNRMETIDDCGHMKAAVTIATGRTPVFLVTILIRILILVVPDCQGGVMTAG